MSFGGFGRRPRLSVAMPAGGCLPGLFLPEFWPRSGFGERVPFFDAKFSGNPRKSLFSRV